MNSTSITNPILPGFNPDPSILRVEDDYYIATSTFEWFPGVQIHHSRDLLHWRLLTRPLDRVSQLQMLGNPSSGGIWAPCLSYADGKFWLIYTDQKGLHEHNWDPNNYVVTAAEITGPWSEPTFLNASGIDPSLFHDEDGRKYLVNQFQDYRAHRPKFSGIVLQEYDPDSNTLVGPWRKIFEGTPLGITEGPHIYKRGGYYYLMTAEGGTGYRHSVTMARSKDIWGPYEVDPQNPIVTSSDRPDAELQKAGHASIVETQNGEWYLVHLCGRPLPPNRRCTLGRETAIQKVAWTDDGWLRLADGGHTPATTVPGPDLQAHPFESESERDDFDSGELSIHFQTLRVPAHERWLSLTARPGFLRLRGRESLSSRHEQSIVARRWQAFAFEAETCVEFAPTCFKQSAGLICFYDIQNWYYLAVTHDEGLGKCVTVMFSDNGRYGEIGVDHGVSVGGAARVYLKANVDHSALTFSLSRDGTNWQSINRTFDASKLSDEYCKEGRFTGAFVGLCCQDQLFHSAEADFDYFTYRELAPHRRSV